MILKNGFDVFAAMLTGAAIATVIICSDRVKFFIELWYRRIVSAVYRFVFRRQIMIDKVTDRLTGNGTGNEEAETETDRQRYLPHMGPLKYGIGPEGLARLRDAMMSRQQQQQQQVLTPEQERQQGELLRNMYRWQETGQEQESRQS